MKIKVSSGLGGTLPSAPFANMKPYFGAEVEYEIKDGEDVNEVVNRIQSELHQICYGKFQSVAEQARIDLVKSQRANIRFHTIKDEDGKEIQVPSVSSVVSYDKEFEMSPEKLQQYASQGNLEDMRCRHFLKTGEWITDMTKLQGSYTDLAVLKKGNLRLESPTQFNFPAFIEKFKIANIVEGALTYSLKHKTAGTPDMKSLIYEGKKYLADWKRTPTKDHFKQLAGYVICLEEHGESPYDGLMLIDVNPDTKQGFSKPIITTEVNQCKQMFIDCRANFKKLFLI